MVSNANITLIETPTVGPGGEVTAWTTAATAIPVLADQVRNSQRWTLGAVVREAELVVYARLADLGGRTPSPDDRLTVAMEESGETLRRRVVYVRRFEKAGGLSHLEVYLGIETR